MNMKGLNINNDELLKTIWKNRKKTRKKKKNKRFCSIRNLAFWARALHLYSLRNSL
jgi:hypothetical protein